MYDWIIEADIVRLERQLHEAPGPEERHVLQQLLNTNRIRLRAAVQQGGYAGAREMASPRATISARD